MIDGMTGWHCGLDLLSLAVHVLGSLRAHLPEAMGSVTFQRRVVVPVVDGDVEYVLVVQFVSLLNRESIDLGSPRYDVLEAGHSVSKQIKSSHLLET